MAGKIRSLFIIANKSVHFTLNNISKHSRVGDRLYYESEDMKIVEEIMNK